MGLNSYNKKIGLRLPRIYAGDSLKGKTKLFAWGAGLQGQLGIGTELLAQLLPKEVVGIEDEKIVYITAASDLSAAIDEKGRIYTWGKTKGMMAKEKHGFTTNITAPSLLPFTDLENQVFVQVACGRTHMAAITADGKL